ncbi:MAG: polysaccharide deacetylase family protein, partial [Treponema sp.]|nr:polysaccharide deacetylase family protein [Treponema sp.]
LSSAGNACFEEKSFRILAKSGETWFVTDGISPWTAIENPAPKLPSLVSDQYRVYLVNQTKGLFQNLPMVRNIASAGTFALFRVPPGDLSGEPKKAALCFDLYDDDRGLPEVLDALNRFGVKATFFLNGEFIRRYPEAASEIAAGGHEAASMFFALIDLSDRRYQTGGDFIARGLARNEDEFFSATGKELSLLWHPPWYMVSDDIVADAAKANYITGARDIDPMDWVSHDDEKKLGLPQLSPSQMIDRIMDSVKNGSVIPVRLGLLSGGRNDYLFNRINVLIEALIGENYTLTTVSELHR